MPPRGKLRGGNFYLVSSNNIRTFALAFESESSKQEKHCDKVPLPNFAKVLNGWTELLCFRLIVYAISL